MTVNRPRPDHAFTVPVVRELPLPQPANGRGTW
jgi:hypothetical protein